MSFVAKTGAKRLPLPAAYQWQYRSVYSHHGDIPPFPAGTLIHPAERVAREIVEPLFDAFHQ